jgi:hypothetical protein
MQATYIVIISAGILFGLLPLFLRSNAVLIFFALCAGELLARLTAQDATQFLKSLPATNGLPLFSIVQISLLLLPPLVILIGYRNTIRPSQLFFHILPAVAGVLVAIMLVVVKLPYDTQEAIKSASTYVTIEPFFSVAVAAGLLSSTLYLIFNTPKHHKKHKKSKH